MDDASVWVWVFPECRSAVPTVAFGDSRLRPARLAAPNVTSHADDPQSMSCPGLYKRITFVVKDRREPSQAKLHARHSLSVEA